MYIGELWEAEVCACGSATDIRAREEEAQSYNLWVDGCWVGIHGEEVYFYHIVHEVSPEPQVGCFLYRFVLYCHVFLLSACSM